MADTSLIKFWMLYAEGGQAPNRKHMSVDEARAEAARLLQNGNIARVYVLAVTECATRERAPVLFTLIDNEGRS